MSGDPLSKTGRCRALLQSRQEPWSDSRLPSVLRPFLQTMQTWHRHARGAFDLKWKIGMTFFGKLKLTDFLKIIPSIQSF
jgi:hypothetical protein